jgi:hypothetical protein
MSASYTTPVAVTFTVRQWIDVRLALLDAAAWNSRAGYPNGAARCRELAGLVAEATQVPLTEARARSQAVSR